MLTQYRDLSNIVWIMHTITKQGEIKGFLSHLHCLSDCPWSLNTAAVLHLLWVCHLHASPSWPKCSRLPVYPNSFYNLGQELTTTFSYSSFPLPDTVSCPPVTNCFEKRISEYFQKLFRFFLSIILFVSKPWNQLHFHLIVKWQESQDQPKNHTGCGSHLGLAGNLSNLHVYRSVVSRVYSVVMASLMECLSFVGFLLHQSV